jgi:cytochrome P450
MILNPQMIKEMLAPQNVQKMPKFIDFIGPFRSLSPKGLPSLENNSWKFHRRILAKVFNYDFITSQIPMMISIADQLFD